MSSDFTASTNVLARLSNDLADAVAKAGESVVTVNGRRRMPASGIIWDASGRIVTANHVVERDEELSVILPDGQEVAATLIGRDQGTDLAVLQANATGLPAAPRATNPARVGHLVLAIGRPGPATRWRRLARSAWSAAVGVGRAAVGSRGSFGPTLRCCLASPAGRWLMPRASSSA